MAVAMLAAVMMTVLTAGSVLAQGHVANDGQTLEMQSPEVQAIYASVWGDNAAMQWAADHNAAIGQVAPQAQHPRYDEVFHVAYMRSMDMELAGRITADVIARGTIDQFMAGMDMGVLYGYVAPAPPPGAAPSTSTSTSSGSSTPKSPSTSTVSDWKDITLNWLEGADVSLTLPSSSDPKVKRYVVVDEDDLTALGLAYNAEKRQITSVTTALLGTFKGTYSASVSEDGTGNNIGEPFVLDLMITVTAEAVPNVQPVFRNRSIDPIRVVEGEAIDRTLPEASSGTPTVTYEISGEPEGITLSGQMLSGTPTDPAGIYRVTYTATDKDGDTASLSFTITVEEDTAPEAPSIGSMTFTELEAITGRFLPMGSGGNGDLTYEVSGLPTTLAFNMETRWLSGMPDALTGDNTDSTTHTVTYTVSDGDDNTNPSDQGVTTFSITIKAAAE